MNAHSSADREVCITGLGAVCSVGRDVDTAWQAWLSGRTGTRALDSKWLEGRPFRCRIGAPVGDIDLTQYGYTERDARWVDRVTHYALAAASQALTSAGFTLTPHDTKQTTFEVTGLDPERAGVVIASGFGGLGSLEVGHEHYLRTGTSDGLGTYRQALVMCMPNAPAAHVALRHGFLGECKAISTACAAGTMAIGDACRLIWSDDLDVVLVGGAEALLSDHDGLGLLSFDALNCLSRNNDHGATASRPFDARRDGFVLGDGAGVLVLESRAHARARGAKVLATVAGYATTCQAFNMVQPDATGARVARVLKAALKNADIAPSDVAAYSAHATATQAGDVAEVRGLRTALGSASDQVLVHALKGSTGHAIAASGALEVIASVLALSCGVVPPTANLEQVDPECEMQHVRERPAPLRDGAVLKASFGFGGHDAALVLTR